MSIDLALIRKVQKLEEENVVLHKRISKLEDEIWRYLDIITDSINRLGVKPQPSIDANGIATLYGSDGEPIEVTGVGAATAKEAFTDDEIVANAKDVLYARNFPTVEPNPHNVPYADPLTVKDDGNLATWEDILWGDA